MKFSAKTYKRLRSDLGLSPDQIGECLSDPDKLEQVSRIAYESAGKAPEEAAKLAEDVTGAEVLEAYCRDSGIEIAKKIMTGSAPSSESKSG